MACTGSVVFRSTAEVAHNQHQVPPGLELGDGSEPTPSQRFLFDTQGYLLVPDVLSRSEVARLLRKLRELEAVDYPDTWVEKLGLKRSEVALTKQTSSSDFQGQDCQIRLNGLPRIDPAGTFDSLIAHPRILPFLNSFMNAPQLVNIWSISKSRGAGPGRFHAGYDPHDYQVDARGRIHSKMLNVVWMLTDNGPGDGEMVVIPGSHKSIDQSLNTSAPAKLICERMCCVFCTATAPDKASFPSEDLLVGTDGTALAADRVTGAVAVHARAGSVLIMSECTKHSGLPKTTSGVRSNLYFNHVEAAYANPMQQAPVQGHNFVWPAEVRARLDPKAQELTRWQQWARWDY